MQMIPYAPVGRQCGRSGPWSISLNDRYLLKLRNNAMIEITELEPLQERYQSAVAFIAKRSCLKT